jgi:hypothetical protein
VASSIILNKKLSGYIHHIIPNKETDSLVPEKKWWTYPIQHWPPAKRTLRREAARQVAGKKDVRDQSVSVFTLPVNKAKVDFKRNRERGQQRALRPTSSSYKIPHHARPLHASASISVRYCVVAGVLESRSNTRWNRLAGSRAEEWSGDDDGADL